MYIRALSSLAVAAVIGGLLHTVLAAQHKSFAAQPAAIRQRPYEHEQGKGPESPSVWTNVIAIERRASPGRRRQVIRKPLLTLEWRIMMEGEDQELDDVSPQTIFHTGDRIQLRVKPNQDGYLTIIQNTEGDEGVVLFPDSRIKNGKNFVKKNQEIILPSSCDKDYLDKNGNCSFELQEPAGREIITLIFSREAIPAVIGRINIVGGNVKWGEIAEVKETKTKTTSRPNLSPEKGGGAGRYAIWVTNADRKNNEELVEKIVLNHKEREGSNE
jgi:hypothetical protein